MHVGGWFVVGEMIIKKKGGEEENFILSRRNFPFCHFRVYGQSNLSMKLEMEHLYLYQSLFFPCRFSYSLVKKDSHRWFDRLRYVSAISQRVYRLKTIDEWLVSGICITIKEKKKKKISNIEPQLLLLLLCYYNHNIFYTIRLCK